VATGSTPASIAFALLGKNVLVDLELQALQTEGQGEVISTPRVITANGKQAAIKQGVEIPYQQSTSSGATSVSFKDAVLSLSVTPQITPDGRIIMDLAVHDDSVGQNVSTGTGGSVPSINTREVDTQVLVDNGQTVVLGGVYQQTVNKNVSKVPLLGDLPLLGFLFRNTQLQNQKQELLIFITPKILTGELNAK
jgi:type IV pilus assembly protein PilQ